jgi:hypothetical protein
LLDWSSVLVGRECDVVTNYAEHRIRKGRKGKKVEWVDGAGRVCWIGLVDQDFLSAFEKIVKKLKVVAV